MKLPRMLWKKDPDDKGGGGGGGYDPPEWQRQVLPEGSELIGSPTLKDIPDVPTLVKNFVDQAAHLGQSVRIPSENASDDDRKAFEQKIIEKVPTLMPTPDRDNPNAVATVLKSLGVPDDISGYKNPEVDAGDLELDYSFVDAMKPVALKHNMTTDQFEGIARDITEQNIAQAQERQAKADADKLALAEEWGVQLDPRFTLIKNYAAQTGAPDELLNAIEKRVIASKTAKWLYELASAQTGEQPPITRDRHGRVQHAPEEARKRISEIMNNPKHPYFVQSDPGHRAALAEMVRLHKLANPSSSTNVDDLRVSPKVADIPTEI